jgi:hypothetical protein
MKKIFLILIVLVIALSSCEKQHNERCNRYFTNEHNKFLCIDGKWNPEIGGFVSTESVEKALGLNDEQFQTLVENTPLTFTFYMVGSYSITYKGTDASGKVFKKTATTCSEYPFSYSISASLSYTDYQMKHVTGFYLDKTDIIPDWFLGFVGQAFLNSGDPSLVDITNPTIVKVSLKKTSIERLYVNNTVLEVFK